MLRDWGLVLWGWRRTSWRVPPLPAPGKDGAPLPLTPNALAADAKGFGIVVGCHFGMLLRTRLKKAPTMVDVAGAEAVSEMDCGLLLFGES